MNLPFTFTQDRQEIEQRKDHPVFEPGSGLPVEDLMKKCREIDQTRASKTLKKAQMMEYIMDHARLELSPRDLFADRIDHGHLIETFREEWKQIYRDTFGSLLEDTASGARCGAFSGSDDFGHTCPDWQSLMTLGIPGILGELERLAAEAAPEKQDYYSAGLLVYRALVRLILRFAATADRFAGDYPTALLMAQNLRNLTVHAPKNLYEAMQLFLLIYRLQTHVESEAARTFGRLDQLWGPLYDGDADSARELFRYFFTRLNDPFISANIPLTLCGTGADELPGNEDFVLLMLEVCGELANPSPKIQIRMGPQTPNSVLRTVCRLIRNGCSSFVFCNDDPIIAALVRNGHTLSDAQNFVLIGCYEPGSQGIETPCTCNGRVVLPKAVEYAMNGGVDLLFGEQVGLPGPEDFPDFPAFFSEVQRQIQYFAHASMAQTSAMERVYMEVNPSPLYSSTMAYSRNRGVDIYAGGAKYNDSSINIIGIATATDALAAIRQLVYEERRMTLPELRDILKNDWAGHEKLRLYCKKKLPKYGCGDPHVDELARKLMNTAADAINGQPNGRGGRFRAGGFSIDWRIGLGRKTAASADGRHCGEPLSKNMCASEGCDRNGVTAHIESACHIDYTRLSNGTVLDLVLHPSAVTGADGLDAMVGLVRTFQKQGGIAVQLNVFDPETLRKAQETPEKYATLQVRLCGWNVYFVDLSKQEQDEFIRQAEAAG